MSEWAQAKGWEGKYEITRDGKIRSERGELSQWKNHRGYLMVRLSDSEAGKRENKRVHILVAQTFIPNPDGLPIVNHLDHNPANPCADNLEWCTQADNLKHARMANRWPPSKIKGGRSYNANLSDQQVASVRKAYAEGGTSYTQLAKDFGTNKRTIGRIIKGEYYV